MEKMNIIDILRDCPEGTKLYSLVHGEVELTRVGVEDIYCKPSYLNHELSFNSDGRWVENQGECILFPSKENRDWTKFQRPFKDGDILFVKAAYSWILIYKDSANMEDIYKYAAISTHPNHKFIVYDKNPLCCKEDISEIRLASEKEKERLFKTLEDNDYCWNSKTKTLDPKFKDGDVVFYSNTIAIFKEWGDETLFRTYCTFYTTVSNPTYQFEISRPLFGKGIRREARFATLEEKEKLFEVIRDNGYRWNPKTKTLNPEFKDGDIVVTEDDDAFQMFILKEVKCQDNDGYDGDCYFGWDFDDNGLFSGGVWGFNRLATEEEKERLFKTLNDNGYRWNIETKTLEKLPKFKVGDRIKLKGGDKFGIITQVSDCFYTINCKNHTHYWAIAKQDDWELVPNKFDISTLVPFESKVLVRDVDHNEWEGAIFGRYDGKKFFTIGGLDWGCCIPYEGNEHLLGKTINCEEFYKNWK